MQVDRAHLESRFREMSDEELRESIAAGALTELALEIARSEARMRGLESAAADTAAAALTAHGPLRICARYLLPLDAQVLAGLLREEGVAAQVMDSDTIYASGALFDSIALGGVRVMVPASQLEAAKRIREAYDAGEFAIDENFDVGPDAGK
jgi:hypothetical protein